MGTLRPVKFVHTSDWQLGKPFAGIADPLKRARVQQERIEAVRRIGEVARAWGAEFVLVAGDVFDSPSPTNGTVVAALSAIASIGVPVFAIPGNHDPGAAGSVWEQPFFLTERARLAPNLTVLLARAPVELDHAVILPCPLMRRHEPEDPTAWIRHLDWDQVSDKPRIVLAHGSTTNFVSGHLPQLDADEQALESATVARGTIANHISLARLPMSAIDYVALGDWHGSMKVGEKAMYSGTHEPDRYPKNGQTAGHVAVVSVSRGGSSPTEELAPTGRLRWFTGAVTLDDSGALLLDEWLNTTTRETGFDTCLVRARVSGSVTLAGRAALDAVKASWAARLLRCDIDDNVTLIPSAEELRALAERPCDPITANVAAELAQRLAAGAAADSPVVREALHILHAATTATPEGTP
jgi:hypothetical protein